jgi:hypothetical protein
MEIKTKKIKDWFFKLPLALAKRSFLVSLVLILFALVFGGLVFYKYDILANKNSPQPEVVSLKFADAAYQRILAEWQARQEKFEAADFRNYPDPFYPSK